MKRTMSLFFIAIAIQLTAQEKDVNWIHGMEGEHHMMDVWSNHFSATHELDCYNSATYDTQFGIYDAALRLDNVLIDKSQSMILVAQSMGGVNARQLHKLHPNNRFGGLVSLGSPHGGAPIADFVDGPGYGPFKQDLFEKGLAVFNAFGVSIAWLADLYRMSNSIFWMQNIFIGQNFVGYRTVFERWKSDLVDNLVLNTFGSEKVKNDLKPGSSKLNELAGYNMNIPMIAIWGDELYPNFLRNASSKFYNQFNGYDLPIGDINETVHTDVINVLKSVNWKIKDAADVLKWANVWNPSYFLYNSISNKAKISIDFLNGPLQTSLDDMAGDWVVTTRTERYWVPDQNCKELAPADGGVLTAPDAKELIIKDDCGGYWATRTYTTRTRMPSDGVVPRDYAIDLPGVHPDCIIRAEGVNHEEMKNSEEMRRIFTDEVFGGATFDPRDRFFFRANTR